MPHLLAALFPCFPTTGAIHLPTSPPSLSEKPTPPTLSTDEAASRIITTLAHTTATDTDRSATIASLVHQAGGWSESLAARVLGTLETLLRAGEKNFGPAMKAAFERACDAAKGIPGFAADHPLATGVFCTVVALGVLVVLAPYVLGWLGFGELGPVEASWAAAWMARYGGFVPKGSLYAFLQRLGMIWK